MVVEFRGPPVLCFCEEDALILVEDNLISLLQNIVLPSFNPEDFVVFGVLDHPPDMLIVVEIIAESQVSVRLTKGCPH